MHKLPELPYADTALDPVISASTLRFHHGRHHQTYVKTLNELLEKEERLAQLSLTDLIREVANDAGRGKLFNQAAQTWNHTFYWHSMRPGGGGEPTGSIKDRIDADLGGYDGFREAFTEAATSQFGSGWAWLIVADGKLAVVNSEDAHTPIEHGHTPLLTLDVWEHAYDRDYQNRRPDYVNAWLDKLVNWEFAAQNLG
jgi:Fe-Mn family superoxide dismutase